ncbi:hypothetical protein [Streptomyces sp. Wh19]|uniref:hypothetical protein n=1 Tax=Streptomyces sp. Wh19 TaxID=3076629 RepID=UPI00295885F1|nr:hypothetical protein [Streptomyces sp. Wh19]MDV9194528.1 hypothetical protein [Streptomyces sp. Wh19]
MAPAAADSDLGTEQIDVGRTAVVPVKLDRPPFLTAVVPVRLDRPLFLGATNGVLGGAAVRACVADAVREHLGTWLEEHPEQAAAVVGRIVRSARRNRAAADRAPGFTFTARYIAIKSAFGIRPRTAQSPPW